MNAIFRSLLIAAVFPFASGLTSSRAQDLDEAKVMEAKRQAEEALANRASGQDRALVVAELAQLAAQLQAIQKLRRK